jgi:hypothetical protein
VVSSYWKKWGNFDKKEGNTWVRSDGSLGCAECCIRDLCDRPDCSRYERDECPFCLGEGINATVNELNSSKWIEVDWF